ncbi:MAG: UbiA family prenyltransferase, partial [Nitrospirae bacterium]|nr:UbiA family prenyltransferase [Nitrospirota bacterium]
MELTRPSVCIISSLGMIVGLVLLGVQPVNWVLPIISMVLLCSSGNVINDYFDRKIDQVNKPGRPIPS